MLLRSCIITLCFCAVTAMASQSASAQKAATTASDYTERNTKRILSDFRELLSLPNVADSIPNMEKNADWILDYISKRGFTGKTVSAGGAPYIIAERKAVSATAPTVLIYAHFDGQPVIPEQWASPPFEPTLWTDIPGKLSARPLPFDQETYDPEWRLVARAAGDDKAPVIALMAAIDALGEAGSMPDVTIKLFLDGEEEKGSPTLKGVLEKTARELGADILLFCDGPMHQSRRRQLVLGVRGSMTVNLRTFGPNRPLHSGHYGNWAPNPNEIMMRLLQSLKDENGMPVVEGFMEDANPITPEEQAAIDEMPKIDEAVKADLGLRKTEGGTERVEEAVMRPAIVIKGLYGGGVLSQARNIIEPTADASLNIRLTPGQSPERIEAQLKSHFEAMGMTVSPTKPAPGAARESHLKMTVLPGGYRSFRTPITEPRVQQLKTILDRIPGEKTLVTPTMGGSLPIYLFEDMLDMPIVILPIANHDNNQHGRNENMRLKNLFDAVAIYAEILDGLAAAD